MSRGESAIDTSWHATKLVIARRLLSYADRVAFLNALPLNAIENNVFTIKCVKFENALVLKELAEHLKGKTILNYVRHESTARLISSLVGIELRPSGGLYKHDGGDAMIIATLKNPVRGQEVEVKERDLEIYVCIAWEG